MHSIPSVLNQADSEKLPLSKSHSTPATSNLIVMENSSKPRLSPQPPKSKISRASSVLQVAAEKLRGLSFTDEEERNAQFVRRMRHVQRSGGVNFSRLERRFSSGRTTTPDVEVAESPSGMDFEMSSRMFRGIQRSLSTDSRKANAIRSSDEVHLRNRTSAIKVVATDVYKKATGVRLNSIRKYGSEISFEASSPADYEEHDESSSSGFANLAPFASLPIALVRPDLETIEEDELADREAHETSPARPIGSPASPMKSKSLDPHSSSSERRRNFKEQRKMKGFISEHVASVDESQSGSQMIRPSTLDLQTEIRKPPSGCFVISKGGVLKKDDELQDDSSPIVVIPSINVTYFGDGGDLFFDEAEANRESLLVDIEKELIEEDEDKENEAESLSPSDGISLRFDGYRIPLIITEGGVPTIQACDEDGVISEPRTTGAQKRDVEVADSGRGMDATVRRKISMKRQDGVDEEKLQDRKPFKEFYQRRLARRLTKESDADLGGPSISEVQTFTPPVSIRSSSRAGRVKFMKEPETVCIDEATGTRQRISHHRLPYPAISSASIQPEKARGAKVKVPIEGPVLRKQSRSSIFRRKVKSVKQAVTSAMKSLFIKDINEALVVNRKRHRIYISQGVLYDDDHDDATSIGDAVYDSEEKLEELDYRPLFTYWVTSVQALILILAVIIYGIGPVALSRVEETKYVYHVSGSYRLITVFDHPNLWIGPAFPDLVHAGAKYAPCMRRDKKIFAQIAAEREAEGQTGCCIMNDRSGCFQTSPDSGECSTGFAVMHHWNSSGKGFNNRRSGAVCGLDPRVCRDPPYQQALWPDDITQWPICLKNSSTEGIPHMNCEVTGRPCCIQMQGQCRITTREYCEFVNGYYHEEALLCSQVNCLQEVCGMMPFLHEDSPNQLYRFFTPIFIHAGIVGLGATIFIQLTFQRSVEKMIGWKKTAFIYIISGLGGYLASAVFVPYMPEVGPAGSQGGLLGTLIVDGYYNWDITENKWKQFKNLIVATIVFLIVGFLPWVDNYAQWFGVLYGILFSTLLLSPLDFPNAPTRRFPSLPRIIAIVIAVLSLILLTGLLIAMFFWEIVEIPSFFQDFNCLPLIERIIEHTCDNKGVELKNWLPI
ncbi:hypothetical protein QR680_005056 [Steinernema hermaphroditum]|uniref:Peptidase S54 rhomboid domain-containing protein n=1 Tax=Steinernema hermaphroditum TaxID=289476 RepID=A0AA39HS43_9BILA|nr:hypothetical protein QR680_005056 [Steinernema hermaphroditum]